MKKRASLRPFVTANFAVTWDGRITTRNRGSVDFSSKADKRRLLEIRASGDALLQGKDTVQTENMLMGLPSPQLRAERVGRGQPPYPIRVIVSNSGRIDATLRLLASTISPIVIFSTTRMPKGIQEVLVRQADLRLTSEKQVDLSAMLTALRHDYKVRRLVCEGGAQLFRSLLDEDLIDELHLTFCPRIFGGEKAPTISGIAGDFLKATISCRLAAMEVIENECFLRYRMLRK